ncbi:MAG: hypothetical protein PWQ37_2341 [Candidatus Petromonas sp.]|nr:hypothetical protein [Candidatus Petromonas sp.]
MSIFYKTKKHREILIKTLKNIKRVYPQYKNEVDLYYLPAIYLLTSDEEIRKKSLHYISDEGIDFQKIKSNDFSSGYVILVQLAHHLFDSANESPEIMELISRLDKDNFELALQAIRLRRSSKYLEEL